MHTCFCKIEDHMLDWHSCQICYPLEIKLLLLLLLLLKTHVSDGAWSFELYSYSHLSDFCPLRLLVYLISFLCVFFSQKSSTKKLPNGIMDGVFHRKIKATYHFEKKVNQRLNLGRHPTAQTSLF